MMIELIKIMLATMIRSQPNWFVRIFLKLRKISSAASWNVIVNITKVTIINEAAPNTVLLISN